MPSTHPFSTLLKTSVAAALSLALTAGLATFAGAEEPAQPGTKPPEQQPGADAQLPPELKPAAPVAVQVSDDAKAVLAKMKEAYGNAAGLQMSGTMTAEWDVNGDKGTEVADFTSSFAAPNKFRHETAKELLFGSTGEKLYAFESNIYQTADAPKERKSSGDLPTPFGTLLKVKNPSLLLAATTVDETPFLADEATAIAKGEDVTIDGTAFTSLKVETENGSDVVVLIDPATGLMRKWSVDLSESLKQRGADTGARAVMTIDYASVKAEAPAAEAFAWAPPEGARDAAKMAAAAAAGGDGPAQANALEGKAAPDFELDGLDGKTVKLADLKGSVVVLDFWATWCGPCRRGMPILDKVAKERKEKGLKVYAVNLEEEKDIIEAFVKETKLELPVLLDTDGATGRAYGARAIPETVIIGKDGIITKVIIGLHPEEELAKLIDAELAK